MCNEKRKQKDSADVSRVFSNLACFAAGVVVAKFLNALFSAKLSGQGRTAGERANITAQGELTHFRARVGNPKPASLLSTQLLSSGSTRGSGTSVSNNAAPRLLDAPRLKRG